MNDGHTQLEDAVRQRLWEEAGDVPATDAMRRRVLGALEDDSGSHQRVNRIPRNGNGRPFLVLAGIAAAAAIAMAAVTIPSRPSETVDVLTPDPIVLPPAENAPLLDLVELRRAVEAYGDWGVLSETDRVLSLAFNSGVDDGASRIVRFATPPMGTTTDDVVNSLRSTLFDTTFVDDSSGQIGGLDSRVIRLETEAGTSRLGFRVAPDTYVESAGTNRVFVAHITTSRAGTAVVWVEAPPDEVDEFEAVASDLVEAVAGG